MPLFAPRLACGAAGAKVEVTAGVAYLGAGCGGACLELLPRPLPLPLPLPLPAEFVEAGAGSGEGLNGGLLILSAGRLTGRPASAGLLAS